MGDHIANRIHISRGIVCGDNHRPHGVNELRLPLCIKACTTHTRLLRYPFISLHILGNADLPGLALFDLGVDCLHERPSIRQVVAGIIVVAADIADPASYIPAQSVGESLLQPAPRVIENIVPYFGTTVVEPGVAPRGRAPPIVVKVDPAFAVLAPSVELPHIARGIAQVVVNNIDDHRNASPVRLVHECTEPVRPAILFLYRVYVGWVVSPRSIGLEFSGGHDFNRIDPEVLQIIELGRG